MQRLSEKTREIIAQSEPLFMQYHTEISDRMYQIMFKKHPEIKPMFENAPFNQPRMFEAAILAFLVSKDRPEVLESYRIGICSKHVDAGVKEEHYDIMADALFQSMKEVLKEKATPEILDAWKKWFYFVANLLMERESKHYSGERPLYPKGSKATSDNKLFNRWGDA